MNILFIGDIVGKPGRQIVSQMLSRLSAQHALDLVVANAENAAGGSGLTSENYYELLGAGVDAITLGDHVYKRREIIGVLQRETNIVKPANLPPSAPGRAWTVVRAREGTPVGIVCVLGQLFMRPADSPFTTIDRILGEMPPDVRVRIVDVHAEATSEKQQLARYVDGRVSAVLGTHTHVPTADECVLPGGTAFQCDVGMTGPYESIIGRRIDRVLETTLTANPTKFDVAHDDVRLCGAIIEVDTQSGRASTIRRICVRHGGDAALADLNRQP
jgi:metallophosphoesterase (TIGR00282 family)